jgi:hypothetical protein
MRQLITQPVFRIGDALFLWEDVILAARERGEWEPFELQTRQGVACQSVFRARGGGRDLESKVQEAAADFRYERDLESAADAEGWFTIRGVTSETWLDFIRRRVLRERWAEALDRHLREHPPSETDMERALADDLRCGSEGEGFAGRLAGEAALADAMEEPLALEGAEARVAAVIRGRERYRAERITDEAIAREIARRQLEWIRLECRILRFEDLGHAKEAALCLREDGLDFDEVAATSHADTVDAEFYLDQLEAEQRSVFTAARPDDLIGPLEFDDGQALFKVIDKTMPTADDETLCDKAAVALLERARKEEGTSRVHWELPW